MPLRITTWNVNGIRNPFGYQPWRDKRTFDGMFDILEADIIIMQELKIQRKDLRDDMVLVPGFDCYFSLPKHKKGYSGVGIYTRQSVCAPIKAEEGVLGVLCPPGSSIPYRELPEEQSIGGYLSTKQLIELGVDPVALDAEGRCVVLEFPAFIIFGIYSPANSSGTRDDFRYGFLNAVDMRVRNLAAKGKRVVVTGDLNVSRSPMDTANAEENMKKEGMSYEDYISTPNRRIFNQLLEGGEVVKPRDEGREEPVLWDICREFHPTRKRMFTHWEQKINARPGNYGSRIDFILCSIGMKSWFCESNIQEGLMGSDHCPVYAVIKDEVDLGDTKKSLHDLMNPTGYFIEGERVLQYSTKDVPALSGRNLQEFDKRRSIKDMFVKKPTLEPAPSNERIPDAHDNKQGPKPLATLQHISDSRQSPPLTNDFSDTFSPSKSPQSSVGRGPGSVASGKSPQRKRTSIESSPVRPLKRARSTTGDGNVLAASKGQQSLRGFFKPKLPLQLSGVGDDDQLPSKNGESKEDNEDQVGEALQGSAEFDYTDPADIGEPRAPDPLPPPDDLEATDHPSPDEFIDPIVSKESWSKLFSKPSAPRCEGHEEPCKMMKTKKTGFNCGREFWMCARPLGPSGTKERNTQWRCPTFIWSSDWNSSTGKPQ